MKLRPFLHRALRDRKGTSAIEFALLAPTLAVLATGIADFSMGLTRKFEIEQASYRALELMSAGSIQTDYSYIRTEAANAAGEPLENVTVSYWLECDGIRQQDFNAACPDEQQTARFVQVAIVSDYEPIIGYGPVLTMMDANAQGEVRLTARSTLRVQ